MLPEIAMLGNILRLQSSLQSAPGEERLAETVARGLKDLPGVSGCFVCIEGKVHVPPGGVQPPEPCSPGPDDRKVAFGGCPEDCPLGRNAGLKRFDLRTGRSVFGALFLAVAEESSFEPYSPFVENTAEVVALHIENRRNAKALSESERRLSHSRDLTGRIVEHMRGSVAVYDRDMRYIHVSRRFLKDFDVREPDIIGRRHYEIFPDLPEKMKEAHRKALAGECSSGEDDPYVREDGKTYWTQWDCRPWHQADGSVGGVVLNAEVINERKRAEETLEEEATRRKILIEQSRDGIVVLDENGKVYEANKRFAETLGYSPEEAQRLHLWDWDNRFTRDRLLEMIRDVDETGDRFETSHRRKDGTLVDMEISSNAAVCGGRKLIFCVCHDISERRRAEESLRESEARLRAIFDSARGVHLS